MPLLDGHQERLPGQHGARAGAGEDGGGDGERTTDDGCQNALVPHEVIVDTEPVRDLCTSQKI